MKYVEIDVQGIIPGNRKMFWNYDTQTIRRKKYGR